MGILLFIGAFYVAIVIDAINGKIADKQYDKYQEEKRKRGY